MGKKYIITCALVSVLLLVVGCKPEPVTTTVNVTKTITPAAQTITITPTAQTITVTKTETTTKTVSATTPSTTTTTTPSTTTTTTPSATTTAVTPVHELPEFTTEDGLFRLGATSIYAAFGGVMISGTVWYLGSEAKVNVDVTITCYSATGAVFGEATATVYSLKPGVEGTYKINCAVPFEGVYSYSLDAVVK